MRTRFFPAVYMDGDDGGGSGSGSERGAPEPATFTQEQVNAFLAKDRREKAAEMEALRERAARADELEAAGQSELEKAQNAAAAEKKRADDAEARSKANAEEVARFKTRSAFVAEAARAGAVDPEAAYAIALDGGSISSITVGDDGALSGVAETVKGVLDARSYLTGTAGQPRRPSLDGGARRTPPASARERAQEAEAKGDFETAGQAKAAQIAGMFDGA